MWSFRCSHDVWDQLVWTVAMCPYYVIVLDMVNVEVECKVSRHKPLHHDHIVLCIMCIVGDIGTQWILDLCN